MIRRNLNLLGAIIVIAAMPLMIRTDGAFKGTDERGTEAITALAPDYQPWIKPLWTPPSNEVQSLLFSLQAALGAGILGYYVGFCCGRQSRREDDLSASD